jgi:ATP adenylyltransferase
MDKIWAPWRVKYITKILKEQKGCVFCRILKQKKDKANLVLTRYKTCYAVMNIYPYNNGHFLIVPNRHVDDLSKLNREERLELLDLLDDVKAILKKVITPGGYNIGINVGRVAGAGFPGHLHIHLVPRWNGDVNFMPVTADTKVISQSLNALYDRLLDAYKKRH